MNYRQIIYYFLSAGVNGYRLDDNGIKRMDNSNNSNIAYIEKKMSESYKQLSDTDIIEIHDKFLDARKGLDKLFVDPMAVA